MSTDQITTNRPVTLEPSGWAGRPVRLVVRQTKSMKTAVPLTLGEIEDIVQQAYDRHGIIAKPSYAKEAEAGRLLGTIEEAREVSDQAAYLAAHDPAQTTVDQQIQEAELDALRAKLTGEAR